MDTGEVQEWMALAYDFDGQRRVEFGEEGDGRDIWVDIGTDEAALDAVEAPSASKPWWTWRVVWDAKLQLQRTGTLLDGAAWENVGVSFTATNGVWTADETFGLPGSCFYRLLWRKE
ncbi:MAG: hypothetical protein IKQ55_07670 [Kiritimatiellae bacterium]|nr:hypothetical protein [Kiritimatiellia bacterium]